MPQPRTNRESPGELVAGMVALGFVACVFLAGHAFVYAYHLDRDIDSVMDRAQVAADASDMLTYMRTLRANLVRYDAASGSTAFVFKTPRTDLGLQYQAVVRIIERLEQLKDLPHDAAAYQSGLDDARGIVRLRRLGEDLLWCSIGGLRACSSG